MFRAAAAARRRGAEDAGSIIAQYGGSGAGVQPAGAAECHPGNGAAPARGTRRQPGRPGDQVSPACRVLLGMFERFVELMDH